MSSETAGAGQHPVSSKKQRSLFGIVVSTPSTHTLRVERLDGSTVLLVSSGRTIMPLASWLEAFSIAVVPSGGPEDAAVASNLAAAGELRRRRKDG